MSNHHRGTVLILLALCGSVFGQDFKKVIINNITSNRIKSIAQDSLGFLWIGTDEGLNRYDGLENQQYKSNVFDEIFMGILKKKSLKKKIIVLQKKFMEQ